MDNVTPLPTPDENLMRPGSQEGKAVTTVTAVTAAADPTPGGPQP